MLSFIDWLFLFPSLSPCHFFLFQVERHHKSGEKEISFPDGTRKTIFTCGREMSEFSDGVTVMEYPEVRAMNLLATTAVSARHAIWADPPSCCGSLEVRMEMVHSFLWGVW